ncbi:MAG: ABC transporter permease [Bacteroidota bacterium]
MFDFDKWQEIFDSIRRHKMRTFLTALSVWWGIFMLVILLGAGKGLENSALHNFEDDAINTLWIWSNRTSKPHKGLPAGRWVQMRMDDYEEIDNLEGVNMTSARYFPSGEYFITYKNKSLSFNVQCVHPEHEPIEKPRVYLGRFINDLDIEQRRKICVIGKLVVEEFFKEGQDPLGEYLTIRGVDYKIVGVFTESRDSEMRRLYLPVTTIQRIEGTDRVHSFTVEVGDADLAESQRIEERIRATLATRHNFDPEDTRAVGVWSGLEEFNEFKTTIGFIQLFIWFVGIGSIIAGVIGVSNIMLIVVKERTKEIGVRKALGATPGSIVSMILQEAIMLTSVAGYFGMITGLTLVYGINQFMLANDIEAEFFRDPEVSLTAVLSALIVLVVSGTLAGLIPALQAVRINPVVAMKG